MLVKLQLEWSNFDALTAISHPTRRAIIGQLANGPARFQDIVRHRFKRGDETS
jgi:hypothetical protein